MRLYAGTSSDFVSGTRHNRIADKLADAFIRITVTGHRGAR